MKSHSKDMMEDGMYVARIFLAERGENKDETGQHILLGFEIGEGEHIGKRIFKRFDVWHTDPVCNKKDQESFRNLLKILHMPLARTLGNLIGIKVQIYIKTNKGDESFPPSNFIYCFKEYAKHDIAELPNGIKI